MSPASSGGVVPSTATPPPSTPPATTLEVEKYIGACLITQQQHGRNKNYHYQQQQHSQQYYQHQQQQQQQQQQQRWTNVDAWAGGMPLISYANHRSRRQSDEDHQHLARLSGAPLILTKTFTRKKVVAQQQRVAKKPETPKPVDAVSVASDESTSSTNSDSCLPRIIKPRKRRKKDRKPPVQDQQLHQQRPEESGSSPEAVMQPSAYTNPFSFVEETPKLHHKFEDVEESVDINGNNHSVCQCKYCDPSRQIWDSVDSGYPTLHGLLPEIETLLGPPDEYLVHSMASLAVDEPKTPTGKRGDLEVSTEIVTSLNGHRDIEIKFFSSLSTSSDPARECRESDLLFQ